MLQFELLKNNSYPYRLPTLKERLADLTQLQRLVEENQALFVEALQSDFQKPELETLFTEIYPVLIEIKKNKKSLKKWMKRKKVPASIPLFATRNYIEPQPKGCCLIIAPWNYPIQLALGPLISALAAGNTVCLKPSEATSHTSELLKKLIEKYFPPSKIQVQLGGVTEAEALLELPFDHIFFTGSTAVGKKIMSAAANNLSSVTLELGGKSPTLVDNDIDLNYVARKLSWAKFINAGQTCVAPDYIFIPHEKMDLFKNELRNEIKLRYEDKAKDLAQIISEKNFVRLKKLLDGQSCEALFSEDSHRKLFPPTLVTEPDHKSPLMTEEIFGPILPIIGYRDLQEAISFINSGEKPLSLYLFSKNSEWIEKILHQTSSGGVCINDAIIHLANHHLPFGGIGKSGMGSYHGHAGFKEFSHMRSIMRQSTWYRGIELFYAPYTKTKLKLVQFLIRFKI